MTIGSSFRELGRFLDECEGTVTGVAVTDADGRDGDPDLAVSVELSISPPRAGAPALSSPRLGPDGTLRFAVDGTRPLVPAAECDVDVDLLDASVDEGGSITAQLRATPRSDGSPGRVDAAGSDGFEPGLAAGGGGVTDEHEQSAVDDPDSDDDRDVPPFKDPELLADVYASCDTFAEMADAIDMDVTAETVRRYMIDFDIHQPNTYQTAEATDSGTETAQAEESDDVSGVERTQAADVESRGSGDPLDGEERPSESGDPGDHAPDSAPTDATATEPVVLSDGIGLPDDVTVETLIDTVKRSNTIYEVTREVNVDREDALEVLEELNLLELVVGRLATEGKRDLGREEIVDRLRAAPGTQ